MPWLLRVKGEPEISKVRKGFFEKRNNDAGIRATGRWRPLADDLDPLDFPGVLVQRHAPFTWGVTVAKAVEAAVAVECIAQMALHSLQLAPRLKPLEPGLLARHFKRKHGPGAYYGQRST